MKTPLHILHLEDDANDALLIKETLVGGGIDCWIERVETSADFWTGLNRGGVDLVISDYAVPQFDGISALRLVRVKWPDLPFILVSGTLGEEQAIDALKCGATDYVLKDRLLRLVPAVKRALTECAEWAERRRGEKELRWQKALLEAQLNASIDGILVVDTHDRKLIQNKRMVELWQVPPEIVADPHEQVELKYVIDKICEPGPFLAKIEHLKAHPEEVSRDEIERKDGTVLDRYSSPVLGAAGEYYGRIWTFRDITERKQAEARLRKLSRAVEQSPATVVITDLQGNIEYVNPKFTEVTGYTFAEVVGKNPRVLKSGNTDRAHYETLWRTITSGEEWRGEFTNKKKNGEIFQERAVISGITNERGEITHFLAVKEDVTRYQQLEAQFRQAQKMEAVGRLAAGVAHDFNNQLTIILGYAGLLLGESPGGFQKDSLAEIKKAGERAANLTRQLLAFSRQQLLEPQDLDLNTAVGDCARMLQRLVGEDITVVLTQNHGLKQVQVDPGQLEQALMNLVVNARDAIAGCGKITIETAAVERDEAYCQQHPSARPGNYVTLSVADTGCGMDEPTLARIFEPFFTTKEPGKGTGLGLAMVFGFIQQSGGFITVTSRPNAGSMFTIHLPAQEPGAAPAGTTATEAAAAGGTETVLLVEDETGVRALSRMVLVSRGYKVLVASRGDEAIKLAEARTRAIDLLITDVVMPGMGGGELAEKIRTLIPGLKVLLISGYSVDALARHGGLAPDMNFLQKPFSAAALARKVRELLDN